MAEWGFKGEDTKVFEKEREGVLEGGWSADRVSSAEGEEGGALSWERAGEEALGEGEGAGVVDLDGSRDIISKGFVFTWDDGSIVREGKGGRREGGEGEAGEREREGREGEKRDSAAL